MTTARWTDEERHCTPHPGKQGRYNGKRKGRQRPVGKEGIIDEAEAVAPRKREKEMAKVAKR